MSNPFRDLVTPSPQVDDSWRWAVVVQTSPILIQFDAEARPFPVTPETVCPVSVGDRVIVHLYQRSLTIMGVAGSIKPFGKIMNVSGTNATQIPAGDYAKLTAYTDTTSMLYGGVTFNSTHSGLTIPRSGVYRLWGVASFEPRGDWRRNGLSFMVNSTFTGLRSDIRTSMPSHWTDVQVSEYTYLSAGQTVSLAAFSDFDGQRVYSNQLAIEYVRGS